MPQIFRPTPSFFRLHLPYTFLFLNLYFLPLGVPRITAQTLDWSLTGNYSLDLNNASGHGVGDLNSDGYDDMAISSSAYNSNQGIVRVYHGSADGLSSSPTQTITGSGTGNYFGHVVANAGDVNGDGYDDLLVGYDQYHGGGGGLNGRVEVYLGSSSGVSTSEWWSATGSGNMGLGKLVAGVGDVNGDGYDDFLASEYNNANVRLYWGDSAAISSYTTLSAPEAYYGRAISAAGDINADGYADLVVGSYNSGKAYIYYGASSGTTGPLTISYSTGLGVEVGGGGDINGDGYDDVLLTSQASGGTLYLHYGSSTGLSSSSSWSYSGGTSSFAFSADVLDDINGDGYDDIIAGGTYYSNGSTQEGRVLVFLGDSSTPAGSPDWSVESNTFLGRIGHQVASLGDVNADQVGDFIATASYYNGYGAAFAYLGDPDTTYPGSGNALVLDGTDDYGAVDYDEQLNPEAFSVMAWAKVEGGSGNFRTVVSANDEGSFKGFALYATDADTWAFNLGDGSSFQSVSGVAIEDDTWTHLAATYGDDTLKLYVNGVFAGAQYSTYSPNDASPLLVGASYNSGAEDFWNGSLDELSYWDQELSQAEVLSFLGGKVAPTNTSLLAYWRFDHANGAIFRDVHHDFDGRLKEVSGDQWATSSVPTGDGSTAATNVSTLSLAHPDGDSIVVTTSSPAEAILLYYVDESPNSSTTTGLASVSDERYWGVKVLDGSTYTIRYYYANGPYTGMETHIALASRNDNSETTWNKLDGAVDTNHNYLEKTNQSGTEYLVGEGATPSLPVVLSSFEVESISDRVKLLWETSVEANNRGFHVQGHQEGMAFQTMGFVTGNGNFGGEYSFLTDRLTPGTWYFRLGQEDLDGATVFSDILATEVKGESFIIPNPLRNGSSISLYAGESEHVRLELTDLMGRVVPLGDWATSGGMLIAEPDLSSVAPGHYLLRFVGQKWQHDVWVEVQ